MNNKVMFSSASDEWATPWSLFQEWNNEFNFNLDPAATHLNTKCGSYFTPEENGLIKSWNSKRVFLNPPYSNWQKWAAKAHQEFCAGKTLVVMLLPARTDTKAFHKYFWVTEAHSSYPGIQIRFLKGRITFVGAPTPAPFPSMLVVMDPKLL